MPKAIKPPIAFAAASSCFATALTAVLWSARSTSSCSPVGSLSPASHRATVKGATLSALARSRCERLNVWRMYAISVGPTARLCGPTNGGPASATDDRRRFVDEVPGDDRSHGS
jgi:hypothetical protein